MQSKNKTNEVLTAFLVKWIISTAAYLLLGVFFPLDGSLGFWHAAVLGLLFSVVDTMLDIAIIPRFNRFAATIMDVVFGMLLTWIGDAVFYGMSVNTSFIVMSGILLGFIEMFLHFRFVRPNRVWARSDDPGQL